MTQSTELKMSEAPITDAERIEVIEGVVAATQDGLHFHDQTADWSVVVVHDGVVEGSGATVREALDQMVRERRKVAHLLPPTPTPEAARAE